MGPGPYLWARAHTIGLGPYYGPGPPARAGGRNKHCATDPRFLRFFRGKVHPLEIRTRFFMCFCRFLNILGLEGPNWSLPTHPPPSWTWTWTSLAGSIQRSTMVKRKCCRSWLRRSIIGKWKLFLGSIPPPYDWIFDGITNWIYPDPNPVVMTTHMA